MYPDSYCEYQLSEDHSQPEPEGLPCLSNCPDRLAYGFVNHRLVGLLTRLPAASKGNSILNLMDDHHTGSLSIHKVTHADAIDVEKKG